MIGGRARRSPDSSALGPKQGYSDVVLGSRGRITANATRPVAIQTASRRRLTRLKEIAVVGESPSALNVATKPPSSTPRLAGTRNVATLIAVPNASITVAVASDTSLPRNFRMIHVSTEPRSQATKWNPIDRPSRPGAVR